MCNILLILIFKIIAQNNLAVLKTIDAHAASVIHPAGKIRYFRTLLREIGIHDTLLFIIINTKAKYVDIYL